MIKKRDSKRVPLILHVVLVHVLEKGVVRAVFMHSVLKEFHCLDAVHVGEEFPHYPDPVRKSRGVEKIVSTCA